MLPSTHRPTRYLFITGMQRSGTTLLDKLLCNHPDLSVLSQPFPLLYVDLKAHFLRRLGADDPLPLGTLFDETRYDAADLRAFLDDLRPAPETLLAVFDAMQAYSGQKTRLDRSRVEQVLRATASWHILDRIGELSRRFAHRPAPALWGHKETLTEEFVPLYLERGWKVLMILRDPRDVLASLNAPGGTRHTGARKPTLLNVRNWRKSVAFALHCGDHENFLWLRYEDLVEDPMAALHRITAFLGLPPFGPEAFAEGIRDQQGRLWSGNSSHGAFSSIATASVGRYRSELDAASRRYVEALCAPELHILGYPFSLHLDLVPEIIRTFRERSPIVRPGLEGYSEAPENVAAELERWARLVGPTDARARRLFLFDDVHRKLRRSWTTAA